MVPTEQEEMGNGEKSAKIHVKENTREFFYFVEPQGKRFFAYPSCEFSYRLMILRHGSDRKVSLGGSHV